MAHFNHLVILSHIVNPLFFLLSAFFLARGGDTTRYIFNCLKFFSLAVIAYGAARFISGLPWDLSFLPNFFLMLVLFSVIHFLLAKIHAEKFYLVLFIWANILAIWFLNHNMEIFYYLFCFSFFCFGYWFGMRQFCLGKARFLVLFMGILASILQYLPHFSHVFVLLAPICLFAFMVSTHPKIKSPFGVWLPKHLAYYILILHVLVENIIRVLI